MKLTVDEEVQYAKEREIYVSTFRDISLEILTTKRGEARNRLREHRDELNAEITRITNALGDLDNPSYANM